MADPVLDEDRAASHSAAAASVLKPSQFLRAARGFSCIFWGLPISLLLMTGTIALPSLRFSRLPAFALGFLLLYVGALHLHRAEAFTGGWPRRARRALWSSFLLLYFTPFAYWWMADKHSTFFMINTGLLVCSGIVALYSINALAQDVGAATRDDMFRVEARLSGWTVVALMGLPFLAVTCIVGLAAFRSDSSLYMHFLYLTSLAPPWLYGVTILPCTVTMLITWKAKELCLHQLKKGPGRSTPSPAAAQGPLSPPGAGDAAGVRPRSAAPAHR